MARGASVQWIGHATAAVDIGGEKVLIDPLGRRRCARVGAYSAILVTHSHIDHLNRWTLKGLDRGAKLVVPRGAGRVVADLGFSQVIEAEPGDQLSFGGLDVVAVPTKHDSGRWRKGDSPICSGYVIAKDGVQIHHAGDVDFSTYEVFEDIGSQFDLDATLLPIGGMLPVWYYRWRRLTVDRGVHIDPDTALHIAERLGARRMIPVHWGTVNVRLGPPSMPARRLRKIADQSGAADRIHILGHGESVELGRAQAALPAGKVLDEPAQAGERDDKAHADAK